MNIQQLTSLKASLRVLQSRLDAALDEVQQAFDAATTPDAGLVVVKADVLPLPLCVEGSANFEQFIPRTMWLMHGQPMRDGDWLFSDAAWPPVSPHAYDISHLTIAAGRGEGEVGARAVAAHEWYGPVWNIIMWDTHNPLGLKRRPGDSYLDRVDPWAGGQHYKNEAGYWVSYKTGTVLDCAAIPHTMTWRAA